MTRIGGWLTLVLAGAAVACTRLPEPAAQGTLFTDSLPDSASVPSSWGNLVSVTVNPAFTNVMQLWFQDPAGRIHLVVYDFRKHELSRAAALITRR